MNNKVILSEINRIREIMKLPLLVEGGGIGGLLVDFWDNIASKTADNLSTKEKALLDDIIANTPGLKSFGDATSALADDATRKAFIDAVSANADDVAKAVNGFSQNWLTKTTVDLNTQLAKKTTKAFNDIKTQLTDLINAGGFNKLNAQQKVVLKQKLESLKTVKGVSGDIINMADEIIGTIDDIEAKVTTTASDIQSKLGKSTDDVTGDDLDATIKTRNQADLEAENIKLAEEIRTKKIKDVYKEFLAIYEKTLDDAYSKTARVWQFLGLNDLAKFKKSLMDTLEDFTLEELENGVARKKLDVLTNEKLKALPRRERRKIGEVNAKIEKWFTSLPFVGPFVGKLIHKTTNWTAVILAAYGTYKFVDYVIGVGDKVEDVWFGVRNSMGQSESELINWAGLSDVECLTQIEGYYDLTDEQRRKLMGTGLTCDNVNENKPEQFASYVEFVEGTTYYDSKQKKRVSKPDMFLVTIGGVKQEIPIGGETPDNSNTETDNQKTYTNDPAGFKKWVDDTGKTYGISGGYVWQNGKPYAKDTSGNWNKLSHDGKTFK